MDAQIQVGRLAATRQTWRKKTVRELVSEIVATSPKISEPQARRMFREQVRNDEEYFLAVADYAFDAAWRAIEVQKERRRPTSEDRAIRASTAAAQAQEQADMTKYIKEQIILLNQEMPNGKRARYCTLDYMYRLGGAFRRVGKQGSHKLVGSAYSEEQYRQKLQGLV